MQGRDSRPRRRGPKARLQEESRRSADLRLRASSRLEGELEAAVARGAHVAVSLTRRSPNRSRACGFSDGLRESDREAFWQHKLVVVAGDRRSLLASTNHDPEDRAIASETRGIAGVSPVSPDMTLLTRWTAALASLEPLADESLVLLEAARLRIEG